MPTDQSRSDVLATALYLLARHRKIGLVWLDDRLNVTSTFGALAVGVPVGEPVTQGLVALIGQERRIAALAADGAEMLELPNVAVVVDDRLPERVNLTVLRDPSTSLLVVIERQATTAIADMLVENEIRKRRMADAALARVNHQLSEFAHIISHDLNAPLRALRYYSGDIAEALEANPPQITSARAAAANIETTTRRMSAMLLGLLEYSRIGRITEPLTRVDTRALIDEILAAMPARAGLTLTVEGDWPVMRLAPTPFDLVLRNLIDNAVKYHDREHGEVRVVARETVTQLVIDVIDDGPGIPAAWHEAIFHPFKRMDDDQHPESSGIGLTLVKRTIEEEGGRIEVLSDAPTRRGTTFRVSWPKR